LFEDIGTELDPAKLLHASSYRSRDRAFCSRSPSIITDDLRADPDIAIMLIVTAYRRKTDETIVLPLLGDEPRSAVVKRRMPAR
jgi:hypothetical protein